MKTTKICFILLSILALGACATKCPPSAVDPENINFAFSIINKDGKNLFFGKDSVYNPYEVKLLEGQQPLLTVMKEEQCFLLDDFFPNVTSPYIFYLKFLPNDIDTIRIESRFDKHYKAEDDCRETFPYMYDVFFNDSLVCITCSSSEIYKLVK